MEGFSDAMIIEDSVCTEIEEASSGSAALLSLRNIIKLNAFRRGAL